MQQQGVEERAERIRLASELRALNEIVAVGLLDGTALAVAAEGVASIRVVLERALRPGRRPRTRPMPEDPPEEYFTASPISGVESPVAPPIEAWVVQRPDGSRALEGRVTLSPVYEGPPTCVHGGVLAAILDELLGMSNIATANFGLTATLDVRYHRPTPLGVELRLSSYVQQVEGRKTRTWGGIYFGDQLTASAEGLFVSVVGEQLAMIIQANAEVAGDGIVPPRH